MPQSTPHRQRGERIVGGGDPKVHPTRRRVVQSWTGPAGRTSRTTGTTKTGRTNRLTRNGANTPYQLVSDHLCDDTVEALKNLLQEARAGEIIGVAFCVTYRRKVYIVNTAGEARRSPTFASDMVEQIQRCVSRRARSLTRDGSGCAIRRLRYTDVRR